MPTQIVVPNPSGNNNSGLSYRGGYFELKQKVRLRQVHAKLIQAPQRMQLAKTNILKGTIQSLPVDRSGSGISDNSIYAYVPANGAGGWRYDVDVILEVGFYAYKYQQGGGIYYESPAPSVNNSLINVTQDQGTNPGDSGPWVVGNPSQGNNSFTATFAFVYDVLGGVTTRRARGKVVGRLGRSLR